MRILYLTQTFPPEPGATRRPAEQARVLAALGHEVTVVTAFASFPFGHFFDGPRRPWKWEKRGAVSVLRVWSTAVRPTGVLRRALAFATYSASALLATLFLRRHDVVIASTPYPLTELAGFLGARLRRALFVLELRDLLPDNLVLAGFNEGRSLRLMRRYFSFMYRHSDIIAIPYQWMKPALSKYGAAAVRQVPLRHGFDAPVPMSPDLRESLGLRDRLIVTYAGSFGRHYRIIELLEAARLLMHRRTPVAFLLVGAGADSGSLRDYAQQHALTNVVLTGALPPEAVPGYLAISDAFAHPQLLPCLTDGTKIVEYLAYGKPIINICVNASGLGMAERLGVGRSVPAGDPEALAAAIEALAQDPDAAREAGRRAARWARLRHERTRIVREFEAVLRGAWESRHARHKR